MDLPVISKVITVKGILYEYDPNNAKTHAPVNTPFTSTARTTQNINRPLKSQMIKYPAMTITEFPKTKTTADNVNLVLTNTKDLPTVKSKNKKSLSNGPFSKLRQRRWFPICLSLILILLLLIIIASVMIPVGILVLSRSGTTTTTKTTIATTNPSTAVATTNRSTTLVTTSASTTTGNTNGSTTVAISNASTTTGNTNVSTTVSANTTSNASTTIHANVTTMTTNTSASTITATPTTTAATVTITSNICTSGWSGIQIVASCINCTYYPVYYRYSLNYTAINNLTIIAFAFRRQINYFALDDVSVRSYATPTVQLLTNGDFETGNLSSWVYCNQNNGSNTGAVKAGSFNSSGFTYTPHAGTYYYVGGSVTSADYISQAFSTVTGQLYNVSMWVMSASTGFNSADLFLGI